MKLWQSKRDAEGNRHLVLDLSPKEDKFAFPVFRKHVLKTNNINLHRRVRRDSVRYRFPNEYLEMLMLTFPFIDLSPGLERKVMRGEEIAYAPEEIPELDIPGFTAELYDYQKVGVGILIDKQWPLNDGMGLGKTLQALAILRARAAFYGKGTPCLVICPNSAKWVWEEHIQKYTDLTCAVIDGTARERRVLIDSDVHVIIINFEALRLHPELANYEWETLIVDEYHRLKNPSAQVTKCFMKIQAEWVLPMSGTPILNRPEEAWVMLNRLWPDRYPSYWSFCQNLFIRSNGKSGFLVGYKPDAMRRLRSRVQKCSVRRRKDQVLKDLPIELPPIDRMVDLLPEQRRLYNRILEDGMLELANGESKSIMHFQSLYLRLRQACFSPELYDGPPRSAKINELKEVIEEIVDNRQKVLLGSQWSKATRIMQRELAHFNPAYVDGSVKGRDRRAQQDKFNLDPSCHLYIGTIGANREAISLGAATWVIFVDEEWSPLGNEQFIARSAAGGLRGVGAESVQVMRLYARNTVEREVAETLRAKKSVFNLMYEKDGGKAVPRRVVDDIAGIFENAWESNRR
jgi:SNF2 family DNA or RNA helicase